MKKSQCLSLLKKAIERYAIISETSWSLIESIADIQELEKGEVLLRAGQVAKNMHFICKGALRIFYSDRKGNVYNKNIFLENKFPASKVSLLQSTPSYFSIETLEDSTIININFKKYRQFVDENDDLKNFYMVYIEKNWIIEKEQKEIALVLKSGTERYLTLLKEYPNIEKRIQQRHIAAHLGITPTQLSRIKRKLKN